MYFRLLRPTHLLLSPSDLRQCLTACENLDRNHSSYGMRIPNLSSSDFCAGEYCYAGRCFEHRDYFLLTDRSIDRLFARYQYRCRHNYCIHFGTGD